MTERVWRDSEELAHVEKRLAKEIAAHSRPTGAVTVSRHLAKTLMQVIDQAKHTEIGHGV